MDIVQFLISVNKISLVAFAVTIGFLLYEFYQLSKANQKKVKPSIPQFDPSITQSLDQKSVVVQQKVVEPTKRTSHTPLIVILVLTVLCFGGFMVYSTLGASPQSIIPQSQEPQVIVQEVESPGVKVYSTDWKELRQVDIVDLKAGDTIITAIPTILSSDIDRARIRVNEAEWRQEHITTQFNKSYNVFYKEHTMASGESKLKIEAQLHSAKEGWLGE